jgi:uncharacterized repeat protein (TIGR01451 family)
MGNKSTHASGLGRWRRKSPVTAFLAFLLTFAQLQTAFAAITNTATATGTYNGVPVAPSAPSAVSVPVEPLIASLAVTKTPTTPNFSVAGDIVTFDIVIENTGTVTATNVAVSDPSADSLTCPGGLPIAAIAPNTSVICTASDAVSAADVAAGVYTNTVSVAAQTPTGTPIGPETATASVNRAAANLVTVKTRASSDPTPAVGDTVTFAITVTNNGPSAATNVTLSDALPAGMTATGLNGSATAGTYAAPVWTIPSLANGASAVLTIQGTVDSGQEAQTITNTTTAAVSNQLDPTTAGDDLTESVTVSNNTMAANDDVNAGVNGQAGGVIPGFNVLDNDLLNGTPINPPDVSIVPVTAGPLTVNADGSVTLAPSTPAGTYLITYEVCEIADPSNCDTAEVRVTVDPSPIDAVEEAASVSGLTGATVPTVLGNDTLNGAPFAPSAVNLTPGAAPTPAAGSIAMNPDGTITVAPGTTAGVYPYPYTICEVLNPANCDTATATITVDPAPILAVDDAAPVSGLTGGTTPTVLGNDTLNGAPFAPSAVSLTPGAAPVPAAGSISMNPDGTITVAPGTTAGTYTYPYTICEVLNPLNCSSADAVITVTPGNLLANDDGATGVNGLTGGTVAGLNVLTNDTLNGSPVNPAAVTLAPVTTGPVTVNADGTVTVAPNTPSGSYPVTYQLCEVINPANCDTAIVTITVVAAMIAAIADTPPAIGNAVGGITPSVLGNDTLNGAPVVPASITLTPGTAPAPAAGSIAMNPDGTVAIAPGTTAGTYTYPYTICEVLNPLNCSTVNATITVIDDRTRLSGVVFEDDNSNGIFDSGEPVRGGFTVQLVQNGVVVATTVSNPDGSYEFVDVPVGTGYSIAAVDPATGAVVSGEGTFDVAAGEQIANINLPIDPSGVIYDSVTRLPVSGATIVLTDRNGAPLPLACLASPAQQSQVTGADGSYRFDIMAGADPACPVGETEYRLQVTAPAGYVAAPSATIPPSAGPLDASVCPVDGNAGGSCAVQPQNTAPTGAASTIYFLTFLIGSGDPHVVHNHIPLDPIVAVPGDVSVTKRAASQIGLRGGVMTYTITATNNGGSVTADLNIIDRMPTGFTLVDGSVTINGAPATATVSGGIVTLPALTIPSGGRVTVTLQLRIPVNAEPGDYVNRAYAVDAVTGIQVGTGGSATIRIRPEAVFDCGDVIGKVFDDKNGNGIQDGSTSPYEPEPGIPGVRLATVNGELITTDKNGQFHVPCAMLPDRKIGSNFILKLDTRTLPTGYRVTTENPRVIRLTAGKMAKMNFGASIGRVVRLDLRGDAFAEGGTALKAEWNEGIAQLITTLAEEHSVLRLTYFAGNEDSSVAKKRLAGVKKQVEAAWKKSRSKYKLSIETELVRKN